MRKALLPLLVLLLLVASGAPLQAQRGTTGRPLEQFVQQVAGLWARGDAAALVALAPAAGRIALDTGGGSETVSARHAGAALRALLNERESVSTRLLRVTLDGGTPPRGFGEIAWSFRIRGSPTAQTRSLYVGAVFENDSWRLTELRILP